MFVFCVDSRLYSSQRSRRKTTIHPTPLPSSLWRHHQSIFQLFNHGVASATRVMGCSPFAKHAQFVFVTTNKPLLLYRRQINLRSVFAVYTALLPCVVKQPGVHLVEFVYVQLEKAFDRTFKGTHVHHTLQGCCAVLGHLSGGYVSRPRFTRPTSCIHPAALTAGMYRWSRETTPAP